MSRTNIVKIIDSRESSKISEVLVDYAKLVFSQSLTLGQFLSFNSTPPYSNT